MSEEQRICGRKETRRDFIKRTAQVTATAAGVHLIHPAVHGRPESAKVAIVADPASRTVKKTPVQWAIARLRDRLKAKGASVEMPTSLDRAASDTVTVFVADPESTTAKSILNDAGLRLPDVPEALAIVAGEADGRRLLVATGSDVRGLVYAVLELADRAEHSSDPIAELRRPDRIVERPANRIRSIARLFTSDVEDKSWYYDKSFWEEYLTMLITQRINRFTLTLGLGYNAPRGIRDSYF